MQVPSGSFFVWVLAQEDRIVRLLKTEISFEGPIALVSSKHFDARGLNASESYVFALLRSAAPLSAELLTAPQLAVTRSEAFSIDEVPRKGSVQPLPLKGRALEAYAFRTTGWRDEDRRWDLLIFLSQLFTFLLFFFYGFSRLFGFLALHIFCFNSFT